MGFPSVGATLTAAVSHITTRSLADRAYPGAAINPNFTAWSGQAPRTTPAVEGVRVGLVETGFGRTGHRVQSTVIHERPLGSVGEAFVDALARRSGQAPSPTPGFLQTVNTYRDFGEHRLFGLLRVSRQARMAKVIAVSGDQAFDVRREKVGQRALEFGVPEFVNFSTRSIR